MDPLLKLKEPRLKKRKDRTNRTKNEIMGMGTALGLTSGMATYLKLKENEKGLDKYSKAKMESASMKKVMPKEKPKDFYEGEGYKGSPDMYPDYEEDKKDMKKGSKVKHMGSRYGGSIKKKGIKVVKASEGEGIKKGEEHRAKIIDKYKTATGYIKGILGKSSEKSGSELDKLRKKFIQHKIDDPRSVIREAEFFAREISKQKNPTKKTKGGYIFSRNNYKRTGKL
jgi:hypothetical protein